MEGKIEHNEAELIQQLKGGSEAALRALFLKHRRILVRETYYILKDPDDAEDIVQETFIALWNNRTELNIQFGLLPYLKRAVWNRSMHKLEADKTRTKRMQNYYYHSDKTVHTEPFEREELAELLESALRHVPAAARKSFMLQYMEGLNQKNIAAEQNIRVQVVSNNVSLALRILRKFLKTAKQ